MIASLGVDCLPILHVLGIEVFLDQSVCGTTVETHGASVDCIELTLKISRVFLHLNMTKLCKQGLVRNEWNNFREIIASLQSIRLNVSRVIDIKVSFLHELDQVWLEHLSRFAQIGCITRHGRSKVVIFVVFNTEAIEHKHPLIDLELVDA